MKATLAIAAAALAAGACASAPPTPAQQILGAWDCHAESDGMVVDGAFTYMTGGLSRADATMDVAVSGMKVWLAGKLDATWGFQPDGSLIETITALKVTSAKADGNDLPPVTVSTMVQPMIDQMVVGQSSTSTVAFNGDVMTSTDKDGVVTTCRR